MMFLRFRFSSIISDSNFSAFPLWSLKIFACCSIVCLRSCLASSFSRSAFLKEASSFSKSSVFLSLRLSAEIMPLRCSFSSRIVWSPEKDNLFLYASRLTLFSYGNVANGAYEFLAAPPDLHLASFEVVILDVVVWAIV